MKKNLLTVIIIIFLISLAGATTQVFMGKTLSLYDADVNSEKSFCQIFVFHSETERLVDRQLFRSDCELLNKRNNILADTSLVLDADSNSFKDLCHHQKLDGFFSAFIEITPDKYELDNEYFTDVRCDDGTSILFDNFEVDLPESPNGVILWLRWTIKNMTLIIGGILFIIILLIFIVSLLKWAGRIK